MRERKAYVSENMRRTITLLAVMALMSLLMVLMPMSREEALAEECDDAIYIPLYSTGNVVIYNTSTSNLDETMITVGSEPNSSTKDGNGNIFVSNRTSKRIDIINPATKSVVDTIDCAFNPYGVAFDPLFENLYICCSYSDSANGIYRYNLSTKTFEHITNESIYYCTVTDEKIYYVGIRDHFFYEYDLSKGEITRKIDFGTENETYLGNLSPDGTKYVATSGDWASKTFIVDINTGNISELTGASYYAEFSSDGLYIYVTDIGQNIYKYRVSDGELMQKLDLGTETNYTFGIDPSGERIYVLSYYSSKLNEVNASDMSLVKSVDLGGMPYIAGGFMPSTYIVQATSHEHEWKYVADGATIRAYCVGTEKADLCKHQGTENDLSKAIELSLTASDATYSESEAYTGAGFVGFDNFKSLTKIQEAPTISYFKVDTEGATVGGTLVDVNTLRTTVGHYYASATFEGKTVSKAFNVIEPDENTLYIFVDVVHEVVLGTTPVMYAIDNGDLREYSINASDFGYIPDELENFYLCNFQKYSEGYDYYYPDANGNYWYSMDGPYEEGKTYGAMVFIKASTLQVAPQVFSVNGVLYSVYNNNGWYYCILDLGTPNSTGELSGGDFDERTGFDISFNANGGTGSMSATNVTESTYTLPACGFTAPEGKEFAGWAYSSDGEIISDAVVSITKNTNLYAIWKELSGGVAVLDYTAKLIKQEDGHNTYEVTFVTPNVEFADEDGTPTFYYSLQCGDFPAFCGMDTNCGANCLLHALSAAVTGEFSGHSKTTRWGAPTVKKIDIVDNKYVFSVPETDNGIFLLMGGDEIGEGAFYTGGTTSGYNMYAIGMGEQATTINGATGNNLSEDGEYKPVEKIGFDVSFNANGGTGSMSATNVTESTYTLPTCGFTAPEGKEFAGWAYAANGDVINSTTIQISTDITLFATWKDVKNDTPSVPIIIIPTPEPTPEVTPEPSEEPATEEDSETTAEVTPEPSEEPATEEDSETTEDVTPESSTEPDSEETQAPVEDYTVPVESEEESVPVGAKIEDGIATVDEITEDMLENIVSENNTETAETEEEQTEDEQNEDSQTEEEASKTDSITIDLSRAKQGVNGAEVTKSSVENLLGVVNDDNNSINSVVFKMSGAMVTLDAKTLEAVIEGTEGETVRLVVEKTEEKGLNNSQKKTLENYEVERTFEAYFESNEKRIHDFKGGKALVSLSFKPEKGKRAENYKVYYVDEIGELQKMTTKYEDGLITFVTGHFSDYAIVYENVKEVLIAEPSMTSKGNIKLNWNKITGAVKYMVYGAKCGTSYKLLAELDAETDGNSFVVKQINDAKLISGKTYKFVVVAYDALGNKFRSKSVHFIAGNTSEKYGNVETITALQKTVELTVGEKATVGAEYTVYENKLHTPEKHGKALRFTSDCPDVVKVAKDGTITAKSEGKAIIYVQDISGKWCTVEVTVKAK